MPPAAASGTLWRMTAAMQGSSPPSATPIRKRSIISCQALVTKACGINSSAAMPSAPDITGQWPMRSASLPSHEAESTLPSAATDITTPDISVSFVRSSMRSAT